MDQATDPQKESTLQASVRAQDKAIWELVTRFNVPPRDAVRIVHAVDHASWHRGFHVGVAPITPVTKEDGS